MASGLLSLKWNNHRSTFFHVLSTIRSKESYCDVTLACDGRFYSLHKFVLSTCSEYFEEMFERTQCKHPVIVLKDIKHDDLEALLNYMYVGEVNVVQEKLAGLIKAAECLKIKGLAVPDEDPMESKESLGREQQQHKRSQRTEDSPRAKRRRREPSSDVSEEVLSPVRSRTSARSRDHQTNSHSTKTNALSNEDHLQNDSREEDGHDNAHEEAENSSINANRQDSSNSRINSQSSSHKKEHVPEEVTLDDDGVKAEPIDMENEGDNGDHDLQDNKDSLHQELGFDASDSMGGDDDNYVDVDPSMLGGQPQSVEDVVAQAMPGSSGFQGNSFPMWEGEGSLSNFPVEGFSGDNSQARQMESSELCAQPRQQHHQLPLPTATQRLDDKEDSESDHPWQQHLDFPSKPTDLSKQQHTQHGLPPEPAHLAVLQTIDSVSQAAAPVRFMDTSDGGSSGGAMGAAVPAALPRLYNVIRLANGECFRQCLLCNYSAPTSSRMMDHVKTHTGEKPFVCPHPKCSKTFTRKFSLHAHLRLHTGEKPYVCSVCSRSFSTNSILTCHLRTHTGEKPYACPHCSYRSTQRTALKVHMRNTHSDFSC